MVTIGVTQHGHRRGEMDPSALVVTVETTGQEGGVGIKQGADFEGSDFNIALFGQKHGDCFPMATGEFSDPKMSIDIIYVGLGPCASQRRARRKYDLQPSTDILVIILFQLPSRIFQITQGSERRCAVSWIVVKKITIRRGFQSQCSHAALIEHP